LSHVTGTKVTFDQEIHDKITFAIHVRPKGQRQFYNQAMNVILTQQRPFSKEDFPQLSPANYRKFIQKLRGFLEPVCNTKPKLWTIKGMMLPGDSHRVTLQGMGVGQKFLEILESLKMQHPTIHDIKIKFKSDLHEYLIRKGCSSNPSNNSIKVGFITLDNNVTVKILVYPETTQIDIGCTYKSIIYDLKGILYLHEILSKISHHLSGLSDCSTIPPVHDWVITHYHFAKDGPSELSTQLFHMTFEEVAGGLIRFYSKKMPDGSIIPRVEQVKTMQQTLGQKIQEVLEIS
jgi:hypothetical protein